MNWMTENLQGHTLISFIIELSQTTLYSYLLTLVAWASIQLWPLHLFGVWKVACSSESDLNSFISLFFRFLIPYVIFCISVWNMGDRDKALISVKLKWECAVIALSTMHSNIIHLNDGRSFCFILLIVTQIVLKCIKQLSGSPHKTYLNCLLLEFATDTSVSSVFCILGVFVLHGTQGDSVNQRCTFN